MQSFGKGLIKATQRHSDGLTKGIISYNHGEFKVLVKSSLFNVDAYDFSRKTVYSKPENNEHKEWTKLNVRVNPNALDVVKLYWSTVYHGQTVRGIIKGDTFIIKKYLK